MNIFIHIPKTGGTTFENLLEKNSKKFFRWPLQNGNDPDGGYDIQEWVTGHMVYDNTFIRKYYDKCERRWFTFLREPLTRTISYFHHTDVPMGITEWLLDQVKKTNWWNIQNCMTRFLGCADRKITPNRAHLGVAKLRLSKYIDFGFTEKYDESIQRWVNKYPDLNLEIKYDKKNVGEYDKNIQVPNDILDKLCIVNNLDIELYNYAKELWNERYKT